MQRVAIVGPPAHVPDPRVARLEPLAQHFACRPAAEADHDLRLQALRCRFVAQDRVVSRDEVRHTRRVVPERRKSVREHRPTEPARNLADGGDIFGDVLRLGWPGDDETVDTRGERGRQTAWHRRRGRRELCKKLLPIDRVRDALRRATVCHRRQRIAKWGIEVHWPGGRLKRPPNRVRNRLPQIAQHRHARLRHGQLVEEIHVAAIEILLVDRLARRARAHLRWPVRRDDEQRHPAFLRLDDRREEIRRRGAAGANERDGVELLFCQPEGEKSRRALVEHGDRLDARMPGERKHQGRRARTR